MNAEYRGTAYLVIQDDDLAVERRLNVSWVIDFGPARRSVKWRGCRFNLRTSRVTGVRYSDRK